MEQPIPESELSLFQSTKAYKYLIKLKKQSLKRILEQSSFNKYNLICDFHNKSMPEDELEYTSDCDELVKLFLVLNVMHIHY